MLIENFSQYPAIRSEIPADMQCLKDPSGSITYNEIMVQQEMSPGEFPGEFEVQVTIITPSLLSSSLRVPLLRFIYSNTLS